MRPSISKLSSRRRSPADFAGLKMRVLGPLAVPLIEALKASAVPIEFGDLYTALTTGLVVVQDNSPSIFRLIRLQELHRFILLSGHGYAVGVLGINNAFYVQLSQDERAAVDAAALNAIAFNREGSRKAEKEAFAALTTAGMEFVGPNVGTKAGISEDYPGSCDQLVQDSEQRVRLDR
jgi:TRAP-type transport system periplasmic protein